mgnify:CR=1 FL=1
MKLEVTEVSSIEAVPAAAWNALAGMSYPFTRHEFLHALEASGAVSSQTGWTPRHLVLHQGNRLVGAMPLYHKAHSMGEYVFDWSWADAWERAGGRYYPKALTAIPFTPAPGPRLLLADEVDPMRARHILLQALDDKGLSGWHLLYAETEEVAAWQAASPELIARHAVQFQWRNSGYANFDDFLSALTSKRRKAIRRERRRVAEQGIELRRLEGTDITAEYLAHFYRCYQQTYLERGRRGYLSLNFFQHLLDAMPESLLLVQARHGGRPVAAALSLQGGHTLFGRYWGSEVFCDGLHFETCYYQGIEHCLARGLRCFDPGTQGEHKLSRGFLPQRLTSLHWITDPRLQAGVERFCREESAAVERYRQATMQASPFRA